MSDRSRSLLKKYSQEAQAGGVTNRTLGQMGAMIREDNADGYDVFYTAMRARLAPAHVLGWIDDLYAAKVAEAYFGNEAFRGATKTTSITETFTAYQMALYPERSNLFVQADDKQGAKHAGNVADMVAINPMWKALFPDIVPDMDKAWGEVSGYWVKDLRYGDEWTKIRHKDPTLLGAGYRASIVTGSHPTGVFAIDDINNDKNTESDAMNAEVNRVLTDTLYPMIEDVAFHTFSQTPWTKMDALGKAKATGAYIWTRTPVMDIVAQGTPGAELIEVTHTPEGGEIIYATWAKLRWPQKFGPKRIAQVYRKSGQKGFARMYLLDLTAVEGLRLRSEWLHRYPLYQIGRDWPVYMGIDYASTGDVVKDKDRDYFSLAVVRSIPGIAVIVDGVREQMSRGAAEKKVRAIASMYPTLKAIGVEMEGKGEEFYAQLATTGTLPLVPMKTRGRSKGFRFEDIMAKHFEFSHVWLSDQETPFLTAFRDEWASWDGTQKTHDDTLDAVYYALAAAGVFLTSTEEAEEADFSPRYRERESYNPFANMRRTVDA